MFNTAFNGTSPLAHGAFVYMYPQPEACTKQNLKQELVCVYPELRGLEARLFDGIWDNLRFNKLTPAVVNDGLYLIRDKDGYARPTPLSEILDLCLRWNHFAQGKENGGIKLMRLEEEEEEFKLIKEAIQTRGQSLKPRLSVSSSSDVREENFFANIAERFDMNLLCIPKLSVEEDSLLDELDVMV